VAVGEQKAESVLCALAHGDEMFEFVRRTPFVLICPLVIDEYDIVEPEPLFRHVQEPHGHSARPYHQTDELVVNVRYDSAHIRCE
jgi:hypothetical protein